MSEQTQNNPITIQGRALAERIAARSSCVGVIGMGYVGLPLAVAVFNAGYPVLGFDVDPLKISQLNSGESPIGRIGNNRRINRIGAIGRYPGIWQVVFTQIR